MLYNSLLVIFTSMSAQTNLPSNIPWSPLLSNHSSRYINHTTICTWKLSIKVWRWVLDVCKRKVVISCRRDMFGQCYTMDGLHVSMSAGIHNHNESQRQQLWSHMTPNNTPQQQQKHQATSQYFHNKSFHNDQSKSIQWAVTAGSRHTSPSHVLIALRRKQPPVE